MTDKSCNSHYLKKKNYCSMVWVLLVSIKECNCSVQKMRCWCARAYQYLSSPSPMTSWAAILLVLFGLCKVSFTAQEYFHKHISLLHYITHKKSQHSPQWGSQRVDVHICCILFVASFSHFSNVIFYVSTGLYLHILPTSSGWELSVIFTTYTQVL